MARLAEDLSSHDVSSMREVHVLLQHVHAFPGDRLSAAQHLDEPEFLTAFSLSLLVAIQADLAVRNGRVIGIFRTDMAINAGNLLLGDMDLVNEGDGLLDVAGG